MFGGEGAVAEAVAGLPIVFAGVAGGDETIGLSFVEVVHDGGHGVGLADHQTGLAAGRLDPDFGGFEFGKPAAAGDAFAGEGRAAADLANHQGFLLRHHPRGHLGAAAGHDAPAAIGVRVAIQRTG